MTDQGYGQTQPEYGAGGQGAPPPGYGQGAPPPGYGAAGQGAPPPGYGAAGQGAPPPGYGAAGYPAPAQGQSLSDAKGFAASLFDFGFTSFVTPKVVKVVYALIMILLGLGSLASIFVAFAYNTGFGILTLVIVAPLFFFVYLALWRIALEIFVVIFRIAEDLRAIRERGGFR